MGEAPPQLTLLAGFSSDTAPSLEAGAGGAGNLAKLRWQPNIQISLPPPKAGHYLPVNRASHHLGLSWKPNLEGKEGGHRGGDQSPQELTAWAPPSQGEAGVGRRPACAIPQSCSASRKLPVVPGWCDCRILATLCSLW